MCTYANGSIQTSTPSGVCTFMVMPSGVMVCCSVIVYCTHESPLLHKLTRDKCYRTKPVAKIVHAHTIRSRSVHS